MRKRKTWLLGSVILLCAAGPLVAAAQEKPAPAYYIADFAVTDREGIKPYSAQVESTFKPFGGRFIVRGADPVPLEGQSPAGRLVIIAFDSMEQAQAWYHSPAYSALRPIRQRSGHSNVYILPGLPQ